MTRFFLIKEPDGDSYVSWYGEGAPCPPSGCPEPIELPRLPEAYERWDESVQAFVRDDIQQIDDEYRALHGADAIAQIHALKAMEATLIISGIQVDGMLKSEAEATGVDLNTLAQAVAAKAAAQRNAEVERRVAKERARKRSA